jgi:hypothetical protein
MTDPLVEAIHRGRLHEIAMTIRDDPAQEGRARARAADAVAVCEQIGRACAHERNQIVALLRAVGCDFDAAEPMGPRQHHTVELRVADYDAARRATAALAGHEFEPWQQWTGGAERSARRFANELVVGATDDVTTVVRLHWGSAARRSRLGPVFTPTSGDWSLIDLPGWSWPAYSLVRPVRLVAERVGAVQRHDDSLGPFLSTPRSLIGPLLEVAGVTADDRLLDVGCGDGRVVVTAAEHIGSSAVGLERSADLVDRARRLATDAGVSDLVDIVHGDGRAAELAEATVVFMFLSMRVVADLVPTMLQQLRPGARLVIHEQTRLPHSMDPKPDESIALIADGAVTVAHRWTKR